MRDDGVRSAPSLAGLALTIRERRVIALTAAGESIAQIGEALGMTGPTVRRHRARIQEKLGARNAAQAVAIWLGRESLRPTWLRTRDVAALLGLHHNRVRRIDPELLPFTRVVERGDRRYRPEDVDAYVERMTESHRKA